MGYFQGSSCSESNDSNFQLGQLRRSKKCREGSFQKNYPKNILIPIIRSLKFKGLQSLCHDLGIDEVQIKARNSASLKDIYIILSHPRMQFINKDELELLAANLIFHNSKISKKAFHLQVLSQIFQIPTEISLNKFKLQVSEKTKRISMKKVQTCGIFSFQSSTIFLLNLFCRSLDWYPFFTDQSAQNRQSTMQQLNGNQNFQIKKNRQKKKNRQLLKPLVVSLKEKLNRQQIDKQKFTHIYQYIRESIISIQEKMVRKLILKQGVPILRLFCPLVVKECFTIIDNGQKLANTTLTDLIKQFQQKSLESITQGNESMFKQIQDLYKSDDVKHEIGCQETQTTQRKYFSPIILTCPNFIL